MKKSILVVICLLSFGCAAFQGVKVYNEASFKTGINKDTVIAAVVDIMNSEGFGIASISGQYGIIACHPKFTPRKDILLQVGLQGLPKWAMLPNIFNPDDEILFSATVDNAGCVNLRVFYGGSSGYNTVNGYIAEKLSERYERLIKEKLKGENAET